MIMMDDAAAAATIAAVGTVREGTSCESGLAVWEEPYLVVVEDLTCLHV